MSPVIQVRKTSSICDRCFTHILSTCSAMLMRCSSFCYLCRIQISTVSLAMVMDEELLAVSWKLGCSAFSLRLNIGNPLHTKSNMKLNKTICPTIAPNMRVRTVPESASSLIRCSIIRFIYADANPRLHRADQHRQLFHQPRTLFDVLVYMSSLGEIWGG